MSGLSYDRLRPELVAEAIARHAAGESIRAIARRTGASRNTVRRWVRRAAAPAAPRGEGTADVLLSASAFDRVVDLVDKPPAASARLRQAARRGPA